MSDESGVVNIETLNKAAFELLRDLRQSGGFLAACKIEEPNPFVAADRLLAVCQSNPEKATLDHVDRLLHLAASIQRKANIPNDLLFSVQIAKVALRCAPHAVHADKTIAAVAKKNSEATRAKAFAKVRNDLHADQVMGLARYAVIQKVIRLHHEKAYECILRGVKLLCDCGQYESAMEFSKFVVDESGISRCRYGDSFELSVHHENALSRINCIAKRLGVRQKDESDGTCVARLGRVIEANAFVAKHTCYRNTRPNINAVTGKVEFIKGPINVTGASARLQWSRNLRALMRIDPDAAFDMCDLTNEKYTSSPHDLSTVDSSFALYVERKILALEGTPLVAGFSRKRFFHQEARHG